MDREIYTAKELAKVIPIGEHKIREMAKKYPSFPKLRVGNRTLFFKEEVEGFGRVRSRGSGYEGEAWYGETKDASHADGREVCMAETVGGCGDYWPSCIFYDADLSSAGWSRRGGVRHSVG